jgi:surface polysaccharide O-acyltransferase-like enzyme
MKQNTVKHRIEFDYLRVMAILAVVILHVVGNNWGNCDKHSFNFIILTVFESLVRWGVPVFVMISGALFLKKDSTIHMILTKYIFKLAIIFLFWSAIYALFDYFVTNKCYNYQTIIISTIKGHFHMWFLYMIMALYLIVPLLKKIVEDKTMTFYFLVLSFIFSFLIPQANELIALKNNTIFETINCVVSQLNFNFAVGYSGYFVLGYVLSNVKFKKSHKYIIYIGGFLGVIITALSTLLLCIKTNTPNELFFKNFTINVLITSVAIFVFATNHLNQEPQIKGLHKALLLLSKCSFGIYLLHPLVLESFFSFFHIDTLSFNPIFSVPLFSLGIFILCAIVTMILQRIPIFNKWFIK